MSGKRKKKKHIGIKEQMRLARKGVKIADSEEKKRDDPIGSCTAEWYKEAKKATTWKPKWEAMQALMTYATGDSFGNQPMPKQFRPNKKAGDVMAFFAKWLNDETGHIFTRKHIMRLLIPFSKSYDKSCWKKSSSMARGLMTKQWMEKQPKFLPIVTPALIAVYEGSQAKLSAWKSDLVDAAKSEQPQIRMSLWDFLAKICIVGDLGDFNISSSKTNKDIKDVLNDGSLMKALQHALLEDQDKATRDAAATFVYSARQLTGGTGRLKYNDIREDKRAGNALGLAPDMYDRNKRILRGQQAPTDEDIAKKQERKQARGTVKQKTKRKNNMRAEIMAAKRKAKEQGGGGKIFVEGCSNDEDRVRSKKKRKSKKKKPKKRSKKKKMKERVRQEEDSSDQIERRHRVREMRKAMRLAREKDRKRKKDSDDMSESNANKLKEQNHRLNDELKHLKRQVKELQTQNNRLIDERKEYETTIHALRSEISKLKVKSVDITKYLSWKHEDILMWIMSLDNNRFDGYRDRLSQSLKEEGIEGIHLNEVNEMDIKGWGIKNFADKKFLLKKIKELVHQKSKQNNRTNQSYNAFNEGAPTAYIG
eukprot:357247_1